MHTIILWNIKGWQFVFVLIFFLFLICFYWVIIRINTDGTYNYLSQTFVNFFTKAILLLPVYWLIFIKLKALPILKRIALQLIITPAYIFMWILFYHTVCDIFLIGYLQGNGIWWDILYTILLYFFCIGVFHTYEYYLISKKEHQINFELRQGALKSELQLLKAQLNPHFLYNIFNTISASTSPENEHTRVLIATLSDLFRYQLQATKSDWVPIGDEVEFIEKYLSLEKERFSNRLTYSITCNRELFSLLIPPMLLQPIVENAVKHGIAPKLTAGSIKINIKGDKNLISIDIFDNGVGNYSNDKDLFSKGIGLSNTHLRLEKLFGKGLQIKNTNGFQVSFSVFPYKIKNNE